MDPLNLCIALGPVSVYLLLMGRLNISHRPFVTTGARDAFALALASMGFFVAGPIALFLPTGPASYFGPWIWLPLMGLYVLTALLVVMLMRPRLVIYNISSEQLRPVLETVASQLDPDRRWAGSSLLLPSLGVQLALEAFPPMQNVQLISVGSSGQDLIGWRKLELALKEALVPIRVESNPRGFSLMFFGTLIAASIIYAMTRQPQEVARALNDFLMK